MALQWFPLVRQWLIKGNPKLQGCVWSSVSKCWVRRSNHLLRPANHACANAAQHLSAFITARGPYTFLFNFLCTKAISSSPAQPLLASWPCCVLLHGVILLQAQAGFLHVPFEHQHELWLVVVAVVYAWWATIGPGLGNTKDPREAAMACLLSLLSQLTVPTTFSASVHMTAGLREARGHTNCLWLWF